MSKLKTIYYRKFPHIHPVGATFFVTFRLFGSIPIKTLKKIKEKYYTELEKLQNQTINSNKIEQKYRLEKKYFFEIDKVLDEIKSGPHFLKQDSIAQIVADQLHKYDNQFYNLLAYSIMSNHVHILIDTSIQLTHINTTIEELTDYIQLDKIMKRIKGASARYANIQLQKSGSFWEKESFDMYIRNEKMLDNVIWYILNNPVKSKLVKSWDNYKWNFISKEI